METAMKRSLENENETEVKRMKIEERTILDFSDCVLLNILSFLKSYDLYCLSKTCERFKYLIKDRKLWRKVDVRNHPMCARKFKFFFENVNSFTDTILVSGISKKEKTLTFSQFIKMNKICDNLTILAIENQYINSDEIVLKDFPESLKELSLRGTHIYGRQPFLHDAYLKLQKLHTLILADCKWFHEHSLMALSKLRSLENLSLYKCANLNDSVAYMSITAKFGFRKLLRIDARCTAIGDQFLKCFHCIKTLREIYLEAPERPRPRVSSRASENRSNSDGPHNLRLIDEFHRLCEGSPDFRVPVGSAGVGFVAGGHIHQIIGPHGASAVVFNRSQLFRMPRDRLKPSKKQKKTHNPNQQSRYTFNCLENCENCSMDTCSFIPLASNDPQNQSHRSTSSNNPPEQEFNLSEHLNPLKRQRKSDNLPQDSTSHAKHSRHYSSQVDSSDSQSQSSTLPRNYANQLENSKHPKDADSQSQSSTSLFGQSGSPDSISDQSENSEQSDAPINAGREVIKAPKLNITVNLMKNSPNRRSVKVKEFKRNQRRTEACLKDAFEHFENYSQNNQGNSRNSFDSSENTDNSEQNESSVNNLDESELPKESFQQNFTNFLVNSANDQDKLSNSHSTSSNNQQNSTNSQQDLTNSQQSDEHSNNSQRNTTNFQQSFVNFQHSSSNIQENTANSQDLFNSELSDLIVEDSQPSSLNFQISSSNNQLNSANSQRNLDNSQLSEGTSSYSQASSSNFQLSFTNNSPNTVNSQQEICHSQCVELNSSNSQSTSPNFHPTPTNSQNNSLVELSNLPLKQPEQQSEQCLKSPEQTAAESGSSRCSTPDEMLYCDDVSDTEDEDDLDEASGGARRVRAVSAALLELEMLRSDVSDSGLLWFMGAAPDGSDYTGEQSMLFRPPYRAECHCGAHGSSGSSKKNNGDDGAGPSGYKNSPPPRYNDLTFNVHGNGAVRLKITRSNPSSTSSSDSDSEPGASSPAVVAPPRPRFRDDIIRQHHDPRGPQRAGRDLRVIIERLDPGVHIVYDHGDVFREYRTKLKVFVARGYKLITNQALRSLMDLRLELLDVTGTSVNAKGVKEFLLTNPDCRVVHESTCQCVYHK